MSWLARALRPAPLQPLVRPQCRHRRDISDLRPFTAGDHVILLRKDDRYASPLLLELKVGERQTTHRGTIWHDDIIGQRVRELVAAKQVRSERAGADYRIHQAKLEDYVRLKRRLVTPLYPQDANLIVSLLDLHPSPSPSLGDEANHEPQLEILEAGTGQGALTLYLSRAVHAANPPLPSNHTSSPSSVLLESWKARRQAIIHTVEVSPRYSSHAQQVVRGFRHGMYHRNIDFHIGDVGEWVSSTLAARDSQPFLSHAFLDLPGCDSHLAVVAHALRTDGALVVFVPSITQITDCLSKVKVEGLMLALERVLELGVNGGTGGREWDVRAVRPRAWQKASVAPVDCGLEQGAEDGGVGVDEERTNRSVAAPVSGPERDEWKMVCRPKVGELVVGGGFLGVFRKQRDVRQGTDWNGNAGLSL